jgi:hypothetical protein
MIRRRDDRKKFLVTIWLEKVVIKKSFLLTTWFGEEVIFLSVTRSVKVFLLTTWFGEEVIFLSVTWSVRKGQWFYSDRRGWVDGLGETGKPGFA